jgi:hypothetical protein
MNKYDIELVIRNNIKLTQYHICPFASGIVDTCIIKVIDTLSIEAINKIVLSIQWKKLTVLIIAIEFASIIEVDYIANSINANFIELEAFASHPNYSIKTRRDPIPNIQINSRKELDLARKLLNA